MSNSDKKKNSSGNKAESHAEKAEYHRAMDRLEDAVRQLGDAAKDNFADRAAQALEQTAAKLRNDGKSSSDQTRDAAGSSDSDGHRGNYAFRDNPAEKGHLEHWRGDRSQRPFRDLDKARLWGICAGVAPYLGLEIWVVRCLAITAFVFAPQIIVPAYIVGYFVLDARSESDALTPRSNRRMRKRHARRARAEEKSQHRADARAAAKNAKAARRAQHSPVASGAEWAAEPAAAQPPARSVLRSVRGTLQEAEQRLRRMEGHVTSGRYELQKELRKIEGTPS